MAEIRIDKNIPIPPIKHLFKRKRKKKYEFLKKIPANRSIYYPIEKQKNVKTLQTCICDAIRLYKERGIISKQRVFKTEAIQNELFEGVKIFRIK